ncbi:AFR382Wp [Eremothecium gossypii ATCC 10895]|uniref:Pre-mRNA-splicing factor RSE1 n=1 Tax=Eremothecium gossypii (strain ATCC 10895 / CBS 109.51 / FGSC 9923 / NRRL Y-1056) TaxID=284811 RepID=RSE1_EREGS|nr:AFR382Wp [Eremothecium gossypii ATCC 10895]Q753D4.2 RecName: Full=Pre-mRNA-splicing factor RSE1 [Eremothecium gossypii ATCC 10895]AAS53753.2 AFR382Wp [Eremothecium gossypii ATCC 10895]
MNEKEELHLYHVSLQKQRNYVHSCIGHFVDYRHHHIRAQGGSVEGGKKGSKWRKQLQICMATQTQVELYDVEEGRLRRLFTRTVFGTITGLSSVVADGRSVLIVVGDSGKMSVLRFKYEGGRVRLEALFNEPLSRSGVRRLSPQAHVSVDPQGRCVLLSAMERNKVCYLMDVKQGELQVSSPLEANRPNYVTMQTAACDVAFDNPIFASLEIDLADGAKYLFFYMLDLGLNHMAKVADFELGDGSANFIMSVPDLEQYGINTKAGGPDDGDPDAIVPFVLMGFDNYVSLKDLRGRYDINVQIPTRKLSQKTIITAGTVQKLKRDFFMLLQSNHGDLYKVKILPDEKTASPVVTISYFDTIPQAQNLHIFKHGYMFANSEYGNSYLYQFENLDDEEESMLTSVMPGRRLIIEPRTVLKNLLVADKLALVNPILSSQLTERVPLTIATSTLGDVRLFTAGVNFMDIISSPLPAAPLDIWTVATNGSRFHKLLFIALQESTMILKIAAGTVEELELPHNPFVIAQDKTVLIAHMGGQSIIQVTENKMVHIIENRDESYESKLEWFPPAGICILKASSNSTQLILALSNNEVVYFEIGSNESLNELQDRIEVEERITALAIGNGNRSDYMIIASVDSTVKVYSLKVQDQANFLEVVSMQVLVSPASSLQLASSGGSLCLHIGLDSGVYVRSKLDRNTGELFDVRTKYLGTKPVEISLLLDMNPYINEEVDDEGEEEEEQDDEESLGGPHSRLVPCVVLHSGKTWISYELDSSLFIRPLLNDQSLKRVAQFTSNEIQRNGCCSISSAGFLVIGRIGTFRNNDCWFQESSLALPDSEDSVNGNELENDEKDPDALLEEKQKVNSSIGKLIIPDPDDIKLFYYCEYNEVENSCRVSLFKQGISYKHENSTEAFQLIPDCRPSTATIARFGLDMKHLVISTVNGVLKTFVIRITKAANNRRFELLALHDTVAGSTIHAMCPFHDKLLVPLANAVVLYGLGKKQLLKKSISYLPTSITKIVALDQWNGTRVAVGDIHESVTLLHFDERKNQFIPVADDVTKRHVTVVKFVDECTVIGGDRFGNIWLLRLPLEYDRLIKEGVDSYLLTLNTGIPSNIRECVFKWQLLNHFYINDIPMSFHLIASPQMADRASILYAGLQGTIGYLIPLITRREIEFFDLLEQAMRDADHLFYLDQENRLNDTSELNDGADEEGSVIDRRFPSVQKKRKIPEGAYSLVGRDAMMYRSYYNPVRHVTDGDLCEQFLELYPSEKNFLAARVDNRSVQEIERRINDMRTNCM